MVGDMYARPKYGTIDLTPFFAPFYMLFFGICLNDAGYGAILTLLGVVDARQEPKPGMMRQAAWFATLCGLTTVPLGCCAARSSASIMKWFPSMFLDFQGQFLLDRLVIGVVQIVFGMMLKVVMISATVGFRYSLSTLGWFLVILGGESGRRTSAAQSRMGDSVLHHLVARVLCDARRGCGADAVLQFAGQEPAAEFRAGIVGYL